MSGLLATPTSVAWADLSPFTQGYVEALLREAATVVPEGYLPDPSFRNIAPGTLARIMADCDFALGELADYADRTLIGGAALWRERQADQWEDLPPLSVQLGEDGKVLFTAQRQEPV